MFTKLGEISDKVVFGDVWERKQLSKRDRSLITVAALTALYRPDQLRGHLHRAFDNGVTKEEIIEVITHLSFYAGWPNGGTRGAGREGSVQGTRRMKIGFIGLGAMGRPMAANLQRAGHALQALRPAARRRLLQLEGLRRRSGARVASFCSPRCRGRRRSRPSRRRSSSPRGLVRPQHEFAEGRAPASRRAAQRKASSSSTRR